MTDDSDYILDVGGRSVEKSSSDGGPSPARPFISVYFECCGVYNRIYRNPAGTAYEGRCPRCLKKVSVRIGQAGTSCRFFKAK